MGNGFLYFVPDSGRVTVEVLPAFGLAHIVDRNEKSICSREVMRGPNGQRGQIVARDGGAEVEFAEDRQTWTKIPGYPAWIGYATLPTPADLRRTQAVDGYVCHLETADGTSEWIVPIARVFPNGTKLPCSLAIGANGELVSEPLPRFREACALSERIWAQYSGEKTEEIPPAEAFKAASIILGINYRVGVAELSALRCLTTDNLYTVGACFVDVPGYLQIKKNAASGGLSIGSGASE